MTKLVVLYLLPCSRASDGKRGLYSDSEESDEEQISKKKTRRGGGGNGRGGGGNGRNNGKGRGGGHSNNAPNSKPKAQNKSGKFKNTRTANGDAICFPFQYKGGCKRDNCSMKHVCHVCLSDTCANPAHKVN